MNRQVAREDKMARNTCPKICKYQDLHAPRITFNGGFWDGYQDMRSRWGNRADGAGNPLPQDCAKKCHHPTHWNHHMHNTAYYRAGYRLAVFFYRNSWQGDSSEEAWNLCHKSTKGSHHLLFT